MSTNHTPNYNLCQWEATDQVLRSDFNQDNAKIDAALYNRLKAELIREEVYNGNSTVDWVTSDLTDIAWDNWSTVAVLMLPVYYGSGNIRFDVSMVNSGFSNLADEKAGPRCALFFSDHSKENPIHMLSLPGGNISVSELPFRDLTKIKFYVTSYNLYPGTKIKIYGLR